MTDFSWSMSHRQLVSAVIALLLSDGHPIPPFLSELGYELQSLELPMVDRFGNTYRLDLHLTKDNLNLSLLIDCKTNAAHLQADQIARYMATSGQEVVVRGNLLLPDPRGHRTDAVFMVLPGVERPLADLVGNVPTVSTAGWGIVRFATTGVGLAHDELTDPDLSASLTAGWEIDVECLPLERLPYEPDSPAWELADVLLRTLLTMFVSGNREFAVEDLCVHGNELWPYLESQHGHIRGRVRDEMRT